MKLKSKIDNPVFLLDKSAGFQDVTSDPVLTNISITSDERNGGFGSGQSNLRVNVLSNVTTYTGGFVYNTQHGGFTGHVLNNDRFDDSRPSGYTMYIGGDAKNPISGDWWLVEI